MGHLSLGCTANRCQFSGVLSFSRSQLHLFWSLASLVSHFVLFGLTIDQNSYMSVGPKTESISLKDLVATLSRFSLVPIGIQFPTLGAGSTSCWRGKMQSSQNENIEKFEQKMNKCNEIVDN